MSEIVTITKNTEVHDIIDCSASVAAELNDFFTFRTPGVEFHPLVKARKWDGNTRLFSKRTHKIYAGLRDYIEKFCEEREYICQYSWDNSDVEFSVVEAKNFIESLKLPDHIEIRPYQVKTLIKCIREQRNTVVSPTGSGKSLIIYFLLRYFNVRALLVVPSVSLVHQMFTDFETYGYDSNKNCHKIFAGQEIDSKKKITITTWQSMMDMSSEYFEQYDLVIVDECHTAQAKVLKGMLEKCVNIKNRYGFTGTLQETQTHKLVIKGLFGREIVSAKTHELIDQGYLSPFKIKALVLKHSDSVCKILAKAKYADEIDYIASCAARNRFIKNLAESLDGNTLILFRLVEKHGKILYDDISRSLPDRSVYYIHGGVEGEEREEIRAIVENEKNAIIVASYGTMSTGVNIVNLHNVIFASPYKSKIKVLQSIGRGLRKSDLKEVATLFDIADDFTWKTKKNHTLRHFVERIKIYNEQKFNYKVYRIKLK